MSHGARRGESRVESRAFRFLSALILFGLPAIGLSQNITEYAVPTAAPTDLYGITRGPDGAVWFGESRTAKIGRIAPDGTIAEFPTTQGHPPYQLTAGPDGNIWFVDGNVGRMTPGGQVTIFPVPDLSPGNGANTLDITAGPEGALWFSDGAHRIGKITTAGVVTMFPVPVSSGPAPYTIAAGPDGNLWYTNPEEHQVGRMTPSGVVTTFAVPNFEPYDITAGPDGAMWFTMQSPTGASGGPGGVGRITTAGEIRTFPLSMGAWQITAGPDGNLWFTNFAGSIGRITPEGTATEFPVPTPAPATFAIAPGDDGNIWFTEVGANKIGRLDPNGTGAPLCVTDEHTLCLNQNRFAVTASFQQTPLGASVQATAVRLTADTGYFWFFDPSNVELVTKVLNGCAINDAYWVFAAGLTNVGVNLAVRDLQSGVLMRTYENPVGTPFAPIQDTSAFNTCP